MTQTLNILIVEDHPLIVDNFKTAFNYVENATGTISFKIDTATNCKTAYSKIQSATLNGGIDFVFLDISLPPDEDNKLYSGEELGIKIRELLPNARIIICTSYDEDFRLSRIFNTINPRAFLIKCDVEFSDFVKAIEKLIDNQTYYTQTVTNLLRKKSANNIALDAIDIKLLQEIANYSRMIDLLNILPLSRSSIEKRRLDIKTKFGNRQMSDRDMILYAKKHGFIS